MKFVHDYIPSSKDYIELINGKFIDVHKGVFFTPDIRVFINNGKFVLRSACSEANAVKPDFKIDLNGKIVLPGLFNTHCHAQKMTGFIQDVPDIILSRISKKKQDEKSMFKCLEHGVLTLRDTHSNTLVSNRKLKERISQKKSICPYNPKKRIPF